uniref:KIAA1958 n=1 Tax=Callorhinchus milii TaxID=7868 RepID=A0A4W3I145_CALMI
MEDCLHTCSENLSKLVSWAHSHGTICSLIPNLKHLLTEGAHGNLTAMWGCSAGHAYHWPLTATCRAGSQDRVCYQDSRSFNSDSPSIIAVSSEAHQSPGERFVSRLSKGKAECTRNLDSCEFSYSEPSEVDENVEYEDDMFDMVCESSVTDEDSDYESRLEHQRNSRKRREAGPSLLPNSPNLVIENSNDVIVKKIKQERPEDYYIVANAEIAVDSNGSSIALTPKPKTQPKSGPASYLGPTKSSALLPAAHMAEQTDSQGISVIPPTISRAVSTKSGRSSIVSHNQLSGQGAGQQLVLQMPVSSSGGNQQINIPLSALQLPGQEDQDTSEDLDIQMIKTGSSREASLSPPISAEPEVSSSQQQSSLLQVLAKDASAQSTATDNEERGSEGQQNEKTVRSTLTALRNFREFLISKYPQENREIQIIPASELDAYLASFFVDARQKDGSEYEPNSLANYQCGLERYLKEHKYGFSITRDKEFRHSQEALKQKQLELRGKGKGNKPHKSMKLTFADELILRKRGLLSRYNPEGLLNLVWLNNTKAFGHCAGFHSSTLKWGDIRLHVTETALEYLEWGIPDLSDLQGKSRRAGTECRIYATPHSPQTCPVQDYKEYAQRRPPAMRYEDAPFYLSIKPVCNLAALYWYNSQSLGKNKLSKMVKTMCEKGNIPGRKTNFSVYQSCSSLSEAQSNQLVLICNNLSQQAAQSMSGLANTGNFIISGSFDSSSDTA